MVKKKVAKSVALPTTPNMFETVWSRRKFSILGKKQKGEGKRVGQVRSRAIDKRKKTLLLEYKVRHKSNEFIDNRFGENDEEMSEDEKTIMRFQHERQAKVHKNDRFALPDGDEETIFTHQGAALDDFKDDLPKDDDDEPNALDEEATRQLNFGGGINELGKRKTKKEVMEELIAKSKHFKALKAKQKEDDMEFQKKLDKDFKVLRETPALASLIQLKRTAREKEELDEYDKLMKEMVFELRAHASDRVKTTEEVAKEEWERLEDLERKRIERMNDSESENGGSEQHPGGPRRDQVSLPRRELGNDNAGRETERKRARSPEQRKRNQRRCRSPHRRNRNEEPNPALMLGYVEEYKSDEEQPGKPSSKTVTVQDELPFIIDVPQTLEHFKALVGTRPEAEMQLAIQRIRASNAVSLAAENRKKMQLFYNIMLLYFSEIASSKPFSLSRMNALTKSLIEMSGETPYFAAICARDRLVRMQKHLSVKLRAGDGSSCWPSVRTLLLMRLWSLVFPCSDFRHVVMTPLLLLLGEYLLRCSVTSGRDAATGLFLCSLSLSVTRHAGRLCPEALSFLLALLSTGVGEQSVARRQCPVFLQELFGTWFLRLEGDGCSMASLEALDFVKTMTAEPDSAMFDTDTFRIGVLNVALKTLSGFLAIYKDLPSSPELFKQFLPVLVELLQARYLPDSVKVELTGSINHIKATVEAEKMRQPLQMRLRKPAPIKQYNPKFEEDYVKGRDYDIDRDRAEKKKLQRQLKREAKGAARELRKDNLFLASVKEKERVQVETERQETYNKAMAFFEEQEAAAKSGQLGRKRKRRMH